MKTPFYCWFRDGEETFFSGRAPSTEYAAALRANGWTICQGWADLPDSNVASLDVKARMKRSLSPGEIEAVSSPVASEKAGGA